MAEVGAGRMPAVGRGGGGEGEDGGRARSRSDRGLRVVPREDVGCLCLCTCEMLCERPRGMSFICVAGSGRK